MNCGLAPSGKGHIMFSVDRFPTEWAQYREDEVEGERPIAQSEDVRPPALEDLKADVVDASVKQN